MAVRPLARNVMDSYHRSPEDVRLHNTTLSFHPCASCTSFHVSVSLFVRARGRRCRNFVSFASWQGAPRATPPASASLWRSVLSVSSPHALLILFYGAFVSSWRKKLLHSVPGVYGRETSGPQRHGQLPPSSGGRTTARASTPRFATGEGTIQPCTAGGPAKAASYLISFMTSSLVHAACTHPRKRAIAFYA
jgi:hypothetical protein